MSLKIASRHYIGTNRLPELYHISFHKTKATEWKPVLPAGTELVPDGSEDVGEPAVPRLSVSPSLEQCFRAVWPNIDKYFKEKKYPHLDFHIYQPEFTGNELVVGPKSLTSERWVWDAHITGEHWILSPVKMNYVGQCRVFNTLSSGLMMTRVFNDNKEPIDSDVGPKVLRIKRLSSVGNESYPGSSTW